MKKPVIKPIALAGTRYKCSFPGCEKRYVSTDGVRKHARKRHTEWLRTVDEHSGLRDKTYESKPSTYCVMEYDEDDVDGSEVDSSWRSEGIPSDNESPAPNEAQRGGVVCAPQIAEPTRLASIALEMNAEALMPTSLPSVPDFLRMINQAPAPLPTLANVCDEPATPPYTPPRAEPAYATPWVKGCGGPGTAPPILPFVLDEAPSKPAVAAGWSERAAWVPEVTVDRGEPGVTDQEETGLLNMAESEAFVSMLLAFG